MQTNRTVYGFRVLALVAGMALPVFANNIRVANVATGHQDVEQQQTYVAFDLSWENSWRNDVNWDAAWIFVKFRPQGSNEWQHAYLSTNQTDHVMPSGAAVDVGMTEIAGTNRGMGVFIYRNGTHTGDVNYVNTRLLWKYGENGYAFSRGAGVELSVHAIEMVYVPEGTFYVGSGSMESGSFTDGSWTGGATTPLAIPSEDALTIGQSVGALWGTSSSGNNTIGVAGELPAAFPKGHEAFYCMKYEITQGQYADFLNLLTSTEQTARFPNFYPNIRYTIRVEEGVYVAERPDRAFNWSSWEDGARYVAWAGLRPMTELEFEKACRGPETPAANEYAWGTATIMDSAKALSGDEDGTETVTTSAALGGVHYGNVTITGGDAGKGPLRVGIFATNGATRVTSGASYWGIMELSGNAAERAVSVGHATGRLFQGSHGSGTLDLPFDWPQANAAGTGVRGGAFTSGTGFLRVSDRGIAAWVFANRFEHYGFRGVRTAP